MSRPLRLEYAGALYHVTARGNERKPIYLEDDDFQLYLEVLGDVCNQYHWVIHAYCLMTNHYHLIIETPDANLSKGMRHLNGVYTQKFNRKYRRVGHLYQGRYKAILVEKDNYLLELSRYVVLNPVRAKMVGIAGDWQWSSYNQTIGVCKGYDWLEVDPMLLQFSRNRSLAIKRFEAREESNKVLILLTDGQNTAGNISPEQANELAINNDVTVYTIGVGADKMLVQSFFGNRQVNPSQDLDEGMLTEIATSTGGQYFRARDAQSLQQIYATLDELEPIARESKQMRPLKALYFYPLGLALLITVLMALVPLLKQFIFNKVTQ